MNKVFLLGRLGQNPECIQTEKGIVAKLSLATNSFVKKGDNYEQYTEWHKITAFGRQAEFCAKYLKKGMLLHIEGFLKTNKWEDKNGNIRYTTQIIAKKITSMTFASNKEEEIKKNKELTEENNIPFLQSEDNGINPSDLDDIDNPFV